MTRESEKRHTMRHFPILVTGLLLMAADTSAPGSGITVAPFVGYSTGLTSESLDHGA